MKKIKITDALCQELAIAQLQHLSSLIQSGVAFEDDSGDYLSAALDLSRFLFDSVSSVGNVTHEEVSQMLNTKSAMLDQYACDGICAAIYELDCAGCDDN
jgi:hypothetical protein